MRLDDAINIEDLHRMAKRRLPKVAFDFIEGGLEDERGLERNTSAFQKHLLLPRYLVDVSKRDQTQTIFGQTFSSPFGISPTGGAGLFRRGADLMLAQAAADANIPYIMSGSSNNSMESAARVAPNNAWYQLYAARDGAISEDLIRRAADCGLKGLVLTVDVPVHSKRERNMRNGFANIRGNWMRAALEPQAVTARRGDDASGLGRRIHAARRHAGAGKLAALCRRQRHGRGHRQVQPLAGAGARADLEGPRKIPPAVSAHADRQGDHEPGRRGPRRRDRLRGRHRVEPRRPPARPGAGARSMCCRRSRRRSATG